MNRPTKIAPRENLPSASNIRKHASPAAVAATRIIASSRVNFRVD